MKESADDPAEKPEILFGFMSGDVYSLNAVTNDAELLRRYAEDGSEAAFAEFVRRHLDLVYSAALRRLDGDSYRAADVAQQVFTTLACDAAKFSRHVVLTAWLYTATRNAAIDLIRSEQRRHAREQEAHAMQELLADAPKDVDWQRLRPVLDDVMDELPEADRTAVLLRFFERHPFAHIGATLQLSEDAARMRVDRALAKLHLLLARRGITSTASALTTMLTSQAIATAPTGLAASIVGAVLHGGVAGAAGAGALAAVGNLLVWTKGTVAVGVVGVLTIAAAVYQTSQALAARALLATAQVECAALRARLAKLSPRMPVAEPNQSDRGSMGSTFTAANGTGGNASPRLTAAASTTEAPSAVQGRVFQEFLDSDAELAKLRLEQARLNFKAGTGLFLKSIGFTPQQIEQAAETFVLRKMQEHAARAAGLPPPGRDASLAEFRAMFGDAAAERLIEFSETSAAGQLVNDISSRIFFADQPFTSGQSQRLTAIIAHAKNPAAPSAIPAPRYAEFLDWAKIVAEAEPWLTPAQLQGVRNRAVMSRIAAADPARAPDTPAVRP